MFKCLQGKLDSLSITQESTTMFELQQPFPDLFDDGRIFNYDFYVFALQHKNVDLHRYQFVW